MIYEDNSGYVPQARPEVSSKVRISINFQFLRHVAFQLNV